MGQYIPNEVDQTALTLAMVIIAQEEGFEEVPYLDTLGYPTIGYGVKIGGQGQPIEHYKHFPPISEAVGAQWLFDIVEGMSDIMNDLPEITKLFFNLDSVRRAVVYSMVYQMGLNGFLKFVNTRQLIEDGSYVWAAKEMLDSRWARQTTFRAERHAEMMRDGMLLQVYADLMEDSDEYI